MGDIYGNGDLNSARNAQLSKECCAEIEQSTRGQSQTHRWIHERKGRITASLLHRVLVCQSGINGIVAEIMGYVKTPRVSSISWGVSMEPKAKEAFVSEEAKKHKGFQLTESGLFVIETLPFLAASPDRIASCECCGKSVVEIKCPASLKGASLKDASKHLQYLNSNLQLKQDHAYYTQVQAQMAATKLHRAYFLVFTGVSLAIELISFNKSFWSLAELSDLENAAHTWLPYYLT